jgi:predicted anti-sigma-YlaC factor YlaD
MIKHDNCQNMLTFLSDFVDGELNQELCLQIETHLSQCPDCSIVVDTLKKTIYLYQKSSKDSEHVPDEVRERLFRCLNLEEYMKPN